MSIVSWVVVLVQATAVGALGGAYIPVKRFKQQHRSTLLLPLLALQISYSITLGALVGFWAALIGYHAPVQQVTQHISGSKPRGIQLFAGVCPQELKEKLDERVNIYKMEDSKETEEDTDDEYDCGFDELIRAPSLISDHSEEWDMIVNKFMHHKMQIEILEIAEIPRYWTNRFEKLRRESPDTPVKHLWFGSQSTKTYKALEALKENNELPTVYCNPSHANPFAYTKRNMRELVLGACLIDQKEEEKACYTDVEFFPKYVITYRVN